MMAESALVTLPIDKAKATDASDMVTSKRKMVGLDNFINYLAWYCKDINSICGAALNP